MRQTTGPLLRLLLHFLVVGILLGVEGGLSTVHAQEDGVQNIRVQQQGDRVVVTYDLLVEEGTEYEVEVKASDDRRTFNIEPESVSGDVGQGVRPGKQKQIIWDVLEDRPEGIQGNECRFRVIAHESWSGSGVGISAISSEVSAPYI